MFSNCAFSIGCFRYPVKERANNSWNTMNNLFPSNRNGFARQRTRFYRIFDVTNEIFRRKTSLEHEFLPILSVRVRLLCVLDNVNIFNECSWVSQFSRYNWHVQCLQRELQSVNQNKMNISATIIFTYRDKCIHMPHALRRIKFSNLPLTIRHADLNSSCLLWFISNIKG